jgi:hypothetical protein
VALYLTDEVVSEPAPITDPFNRELPPAADYELKMVNGVMHVYHPGGGDQLAFGPIHGIMEFIADQNMLFALIADGPL